MTQQVTPEVVVHQGAPGDGPRLSDNELIAIDEGGERAYTRDIRDVRHTPCCIVGGGPAGLMLALLLARQNVPVILLEAFHDFERDFRGDTLQPSVMEILAELGYADEVHQLPHAKVAKYTFVGPNGQIVTSDCSRLKSPYPYITCMNQTLLLDFLADKATQYPGCTIIMGAVLKN